MFNTINSIYSPESIAFQNDAFHKTLTSIYEQFRTDKTGKNHTELEMALSKAIKDYTNLNVDVQIGEYPMMTEVPHIDKNSPLLEGYGWKETSLSKKGLADIRKSSDLEVRGLLDPQASYVNGYFADLDPVRMFLNGSMIYGNSGLLYKLFDNRTYTSAELSAITLHEVGHIWAFLYFLVHFRTTNQIMSAMIRELDGTEDFGKREIIIREASSLLKLESVDAMELSKKNKTTIYTVVISNLARKNRSQSGAEGYDINSFEAMADQFATRHGAGRDAVTGLDKIYKGTIYRRGWTGYFFGELLKLAALGLGIFEISIGNGMAAYSTFILLIGLIVSDSHTDWYDKPGARFKRIRNQLVEQLKDATTPRESSIRIRDDIDAIDKINEAYRDHTQLVGLVYDYLIPTGVSKRKEIEFQQSLEELAANKLYYYANKFKNA